MVRTRRGARSTIRDEKHLPLGESDQHSPVAAPVRVDSSGIGHGRQLEDGRGRNGRGLVCGDGLKIRVQASRFVYNDPRRPPDRIILGRVVLVREEVGSGERGLGVVWAQGALACWPASEMKCWWQ
jgi:hypothetical protein